MQRGQGTRELNAAIGEAAKAIGRQAFYDRLLQVLRLAVPNDMATVVRYSAIGAPVFLLHHGYRDDLVQQYQSTFYVFDPFHRHWTREERAGVVPLATFPAVQARHDRYVWEFLERSRIVDELGVFLPAVGRTSIAMFLERAEERFAPRDIQAVEELFPALAGLHVAHVDQLFLKADGDLGLAGHVPMMITDRDGHVVHRSPAWRALEAADRSLPGRLATFASDVALDGGRILQRVAVSELFAFAPGGWIWTVERRADAGRFTDDVIRALSGELTAREIEIVRLILEGHPTVSIAERLRLSRGTVKNHRLNIYQKLDITTERELFLRYIQALEQVPAS